MPIKVGFVSLGCPKNLVNTENMLAILAQNGFEIVAEDVEADVIVINTCAFIESAKKEAIDNILDVAWLKENHTLKGIVVTGCLPERYREEILNEMPEVDCILGTGSFGNICEAVKAAYEGKKYSSFEDKNTANIGGERVITTPEYFAYLQIAEGCDNHCTYCVIPSIRGRFRSRPMSDILEEAQNLADLGVKELCLIAQDTTRYGEDLYGVYSLDSLIHELSQIEGIEWIRVMYCYPDRITDGLINEFATNPKLVKYIDMPIQHISTPVLKRMNRRDTEESIRNVVKKLRDAVPGIYIRTTVITGFPGETDADFDKLLSFIKEARFERLGAFVYSREEGTPAYNMPDQVPEKLKRRRHDAIMREQKRIHDSINKNSVGKIIRVINEGYDQVAESYYGRSFADAPEIDGKIYYSSPRRLREGEFVDVLVNEVLDYDLTGRVVK
ncbi:MAG: 30S ribosomal protein S12 methylthiotransferase RimO [Clostridia bacterium]|nr:30S ribosomal protein S12 methylthiotransferase RimO [Clostridia bacterium]MBO7216646.1 30S ribosomal protein S12 methylthiotransferase RimO [Clostridia bacterium]MBO7246491.1 30S ribosomal protein S12 methylthiotransferase RimO [Clostridia bacterium]MBO7738581.1 30S ribosomal protein S12 methylthiotransferase RimO [Clostridia bacterium]